MKYLLLSLVVASCIAASTQSWHHCKCQSEFFKDDDLTSLDDRKTVFAAAFEDFILQRIVFPNCTSQLSKTCAGVCVKHYKHQMELVKDVHGKVAESYDQVVDFYGQHGTVGDFTCNYLQEVGKVPVSDAKWGMFSRLENCGQNFTFAGYSRAGSFSCDASGKYIHS